MAIGVGHFERRLVPDVAPGAGTQGRRRTRAIAAGVRSFVEIGHGKVLRGLVRGVDKEATLFGSDEPETLEAAAQALMGAPA